MTEAASEKQAEGTFNAVLFPHRSLSPSGFLVLMSLIGFLSFALGLTFASIGAWPVMGFFGLDALLIFAAFQLNYRSGREYEIINLDPRQLVLTHVDPKGRSKSIDFHTYWVRVNLFEGRDGRTRLSLSSHGNEIVFGRFLTDGERKDFAEALSEAIAIARRVPVA